MNKFEALRKASLDPNSRMRGPTINGELISGLDQATRDAIVINALKLIGIKNPVIPGRSHG